MTLVPDMLFLQACLDEVRDGEQVTIKTQLSEKRIRSALIRLGATDYEIDAICIVRFGAAMGNSTPLPRPRMSGGSAQRALEARQLERSTSTKAKASGRKGGLAGRVYKAIAVGDVFGVWRVIRLLGRSHHGRADMRVRLACDRCGHEKDVFEFQARAQSGACTGYHKRGRR